MATITGEAFDLTALAAAQSKIAMLDLPDNGGSDKQAFTPPMPAAPPAAGGPPPGMPPTGGPPPTGPSPMGGGMTAPPPGPPPAGDTGAAGGAGGVDPNAVMEAMGGMGMTPPTAGSPDIKMNMDELIKLITAITGKGNNAGKKVEQENLLLKHTLQQNGLPAPEVPGAKEDPQQQGDPSLISAVGQPAQPISGGFPPMPPPSAPTKSGTARTRSADILDRLRNMI